MTNTGNTTGTDLAGWVDMQMTDSGLDDEVGMVILAALDGDTELDAYLGGGVQPTRPSGDTDDAAEAAGGTFLASIVVEGFRGIGESTRLDLSPRPGLTIVAGRNGSGKSSLSEALEFVLTGNTYRWNKSSVMWRQSWRNLHHGTAALRIDVVEEATGPISLMARWPDAETDVNQAEIRTQRPSEKEQPGLASLGWTRAVERYRPILSYDELGGLLEGKPTELYDSLAGILGVEQLTDALKRIQVRHKTVKEPGTAVLARRKELQAQAVAFDDERGTAAAMLLKPSSPDIEKIRELVTGAAPTAQGPIQALRAIVAVTPPFADTQPTEAADAVRRAASVLESVTADTSARTLARLELLERAIKVHDDHGDMTCPVCRKTTLDAEWHQTSIGLVADQQRDLRELRTAQQDRDLAVTKARALLASRPAALNASPTADLESLLLAAREAWDAWAQAPAEDASPEALAVHVATLSGPLVTALDELKVEASKALASLDDAWQPFATRLGAWTDEQSSWLDAKPTVDRLAAAEKWLKANTQRLQNEMLEPIADGARNAWSKLRQESNVELGSLSLTGSGPQRKLKINTAVDDATGQGFTVLSQGELHALALALFLPRATRMESPFRFVVLDDPVQAMDPAKVDGLVELLSDIARTHQVVVLSHDDRLPAAVRRSPVDATILEVTRGVGSRVSVDLATDPAARYLADAHGLVSESQHDNVTDSALRRTLPGLLRMAAEAAAKDRYFARSLSAGAPLTDVEKAWDDATTTRLKITLAVFGELRANAELDQWAAAPYRKFGLRNIGTAMHAGLKPELDPRDAVRDVEKLVADIRAAK